MTPKPCEYCGELMEVRTIEFGGKPAFAGFVQCECDGAKEARRQAEEAERAERRAKEAEARERALTRAGIPRRYREASHPYADKMARMAKDGQGFYIHGPNGTYKTTLAMAAALKLIEAKVDVFALPTYQLMDAMRSRKDEDRTLFDRAANCGVLILDDLGKEATNTQYACERLFAIIDTRDRELRPTIITSNYKLSEIAKNITEGDVGKAIASRLASSCTKVALEGEDRRLNGNH
jgi:DNA replication protein DnaC/primosomal protein DnaI